MPTKRQKIDKDKKVVVNIRRPGEERLVDNKLIRRKTFPVAKVLLLAAALGIFAGGLVVGYLYFYGNPLEEKVTPEIIVPEPEPEPVATSTPAVEAKKSFVEILETPTGFLNVREGPGTNFKKVGQIKPGEAYELLSTNAEKTWYQIKISETLSGWIINQYAKVK